MTEKIKRIAKKLNISDVITEELSKKDDHSDFKMNTRGFVEKIPDLHDTKPRPKMTERQLENLKNARAKAHEVLRAKGAISRAKRDEQIKKRDELLEKAKQCSTPSAEQGIALMPSAERGVILKKARKPKKTVVYVSDSESESSEEEQVVYVKKPKNTKQTSIKVPTAERGYAPMPTAEEPPADAPLSMKQQRINSFLSLYGI